MPKLREQNRQAIKGSSKGAAAAPAKAKQKRSKSKGTSQQQLSAAQLFERAQAAIAFERYDAALECLKDALELEPENVEIIDARGALLAELGREEEAIQELQRAVQLSPDTGFEKYMYLGQLLQGEEALTATQKGVELLQQDVNMAQEAGARGAEHRQLCHQLSAALCSLAEMRMALAEEVAEVSAVAEALLQRARSVDAHSPQPLQALASLRYEQGQAEEALQLLRQSMGLWFKPQGGSGEESGSEGDDDMQEEAAAAEDDDDGDFRIPKKPTTMSEEEVEVGAGRGRQHHQGSSDDDDEASEWEDAEDDDDDDDDDEGLPSYEFRFEAAKMLLELDDTTEVAIQVLEDLLAENDAVLDVWHLLGLSYYSGGMLDEAAEVCKHGMQLMKQQHVAPDEGIALAFDDLHSAITEAQAAADAQS